MEASVASYGAASGGLWQEAVALRVRMPLELSVRFGQGDENAGMPGGVSK